MVQPIRLANTPVGRRVSWVLDRIASGSEVEHEEIREHFAPAFLGAIPPERVQKMFRDLGADGLTSVEIREDPATPFALRGSAVNGDNRLLIGAQVEREQPHRLIFLLFRRDWSIQQIFDETPGSSASVEDILNEHISPLIERLAPGGVVVGVVKGAETYIQKFGPVSEDQIFEIGSVTKPFTGTLLAEMVEAAEVVLEDYVARFFPEDVPLPKDDSGREIRLIDLVTHSASLPRLPPDWAPPDPLDPYAHFTVETLYESLPKTVLDIPIGSFFKYSNYGFAILGHALSRAADIPYSQLVVDRVCRPLGLIDTGIELGEEYRERRAQGHGLSGNQMSPWHRPVFASAGGIETTIADLTRFVAAQVDPNSTPLLTAILETHVPRIASGPDSHMGLAWQIAVLIDGSHCIWHSGQTGGFSSSLVFHPAKGIGVAAISNTTSNRLDQQTTTILATLANT